MHALAAVIAAVFAVGAPNPPAIDRQSPILEAIAARYTGHPVRVECVAGIFGAGAQDPGTIWLDNVYCSPLEALSRGVEVASARQGAGLITLAHEALHERGLISEAKTECWAFQQSDDVLRLFAGPISRNWRSVVLTEAYVDHFRVTSKHPLYRDRKRCHAGGRWDMTPGDGRWP